MLALIGGILMWICLFCIGLTIIGFISIKIYSPRRIKEYDTHAEEIIKLIKKQEERFNHMSWFEKRETIKKWGIYYAHQPGK